MLTLDLARLGREGAARVDARVPAADPLWGGAELSLDGPVEVQLRATGAGSGELVVRGQVRGNVRRECRRCLEPVRAHVQQDVTWVFVPTGHEGEDEGDVRTFDPRSSEIDVSESVREELILAVDPFVVCDPECKGLCPRCGVNRNVEPCQCVDQAPDPRWDVLRALQDE